MAVAAIRFMTSVKTFNARQICAFGAGRNLICTPNQLTDNAFSYTYLVSRAMVQQAWGHSNAADFTCRTDDVWGPVLRLKEHYTDEGTGVDVPVHIPSSADGFVMEYSVNMNRGNAYFFFSIHPNCCDLEERGTSG